MACAGAGAVGVRNTNLLYHNNGNGTFTNVAATQGLELEDDGVSPHRAAAWTDYNNDGFLDLIIKDSCGPEHDTGEDFIGLNRLFKNRHSDNGNHFIKLQLVGVQSNRDGIGARATVTYAGGRAFRQNNGGGGGEFWSQGSEPLHFGIGAASVASVQIIWPSGVVDVFPTVLADSTFTVVDGNSP